MDSEQSIRSHLEEIRKGLLGDFLYIEEAVDSKLQITALAFELESKERSPVLYFAKVKGSKLPLVTNLLACRDRLALALGVPTDKLSDRIETGLKSPKPFRLIDSAPFHEKVLPATGETLRSLPILHHYPLDAGPYIMGGLIISKDPETGRPTMGYHRLLFNGSEELGVSLHSRRSMWENVQKAEEKNIALPAVVAIGVHPLISLAAMMDSPPKMTKFDIAGGLFGAPLEVAEASDTGMEAPAWSEIVIDGEFVPNLRRNEGPVGEFTGYASERSTRHVFRAKRILMREDAIYQDICPGPSADQLVYLALLREKNLFREIHESFPNLKRVHVPLSGSAYFLCYLALEDPLPGSARQALLKVLGSDRNVKIAIAVNEDIDVTNEQEVLWAVTTRVRPDRDIVIIPDMVGTMLDPSSEESGRTAKVTIDATRKGEGFPKKVTFPEETVVWAKTFAEEKLGVAVAGMTTALNRSPAV